MDSGSAQAPRPGGRWLNWPGYVVTAILEVALTAGLLALQSVFPLANYPIPYVVLIMVVAYLFGEGPAILAFVTGFLAFVRYFVPPDNLVWPIATDPAGWAKVTAFFLGTSIVGFATILMRRSQRRMGRLTRSLAEAKALLEDRQEELEKSLERERHIAETLQTNLLSDVPTKMHFLELETLYRAAWEESRVGGDFYDVFLLGESKIGIVIGDVSGKGLKAAVQVAMTKYSLRTWAYDNDGPAGVLTHVNETLVRDMDSEGFVTLFFGVIDLASREMVYANGGHWPVMLWKAREGQAESLDSTGPLVGATITASYVERCVALEQGDELLLGTDGLLDIRSRQETPTLEDLLQMYVRQKQNGAGSAAAFVEMLVTAWNGELRDDVALLRVLVEE